MKKIILALAGIVLFTSHVNVAFLATNDFSDVSQTSPYYTAITDLKTRGIISGYPDGTFRPDQEVNRAEALKIILLGAGINTGSSSATAHFSDTSSTAWYAPYLNKAVELGIVQGYPDGTFQPAQTVNLVENLKMLLVAKNVALSNVTVTQNPYADAFSGQWYSKFVEYAKDKNLIDADPQNKIYPAQGMTRGKLAETLYRLLYIQDNGLSSFPATTVSVPVQNPTPTPPPASGTGVNFTIDPTLNRQTISPYIYGSNEITEDNGQPREPGMKLIRSGGNRWTAYDWENNASNAGTDWGPNSSDSYLSDSKTPGDAVKTRVDAAFGLGAAALITVPIVDYVAADENGIVTDIASDTNSRWDKNLPTTPGTLPLTPDLQDHTVYQDQFVTWVQNTYQSSLNSGKQIFYSLDNEPGLWPSTHPLVHPQQTTYAEMAKRTADFSAMIKKIAPNSLVFGAVAFGYSEYLNLQSAPDANGRDYLDFFLDSAKAAETSAGRRLVDVLDLHWYPEAKGGGVRITDSQSAAPSDAEVEARVQAPRSLWDPTYVEDSWITADVLNNGPIELIPWLQTKIAAHYPGTKLSFSEYEYGGANHISGGIAEADVLGIFGKENVFAATLWPEGFSNTPDTYIYGAFDLYLNYDGQGDGVGDTSVSAQNSDINDTSVYAIAKSSDSTVLYIVAINKTKNVIPANVAVANSSAFASGQVYQLTAANMKPQAAGSFAVQNNQFTYQMPAWSVSLWVLKTT